VAIFFQNRIAKYAAQAIPEAAACKSAPTRMRRYGLDDLLPSARQLRSSDTIRRELAGKLNDHLIDATLVTTKRKPFDAIAEGLDLQNSRGDSVFTEPKIEFTAADLRAA